MWCDAKSRGEIELKSRITVVIGQLSMLCFEFLLAHFLFISSFACKEEVALLQAVFDGQITVQLMRMQNGMLKVDALITWK